MGLPSVLIAYITVYIQDAAAVKMHGFFGGYNNIVWTVIIVQAVGGLIVATVVKVCFFSPTFNFFSKLHWISFRVLGLIFIKLCISTRTMY